jgi:hypothetical protein
MPATSEQINRVQIADEHAYFRTLPTERLRAMVDDPMTFGVRERLDADIVLQDRKRHAERQKRRGIGAPAERYHKVGW